MRVHNSLCPALDEKIYENSLIIALERLGIDCEQQARFPVYFDHKPVGTLIPDLIVDEKIIVDAKVVESFTKTHESQILGYLSISGLKIGYLINFKHFKIQWKRFTRL